MKFGQSIPDGQLADQLQRVINATPFFQKKIQGIPLQRFTIGAFEDLPYSSIEEYKQRENLNDLYYDQHEGNYVFISEGSGRIARAIFWTKKYLESQTTILAEVLVKLGLSQDDWVLNLFEPGISGIWQFFNQAFEKTGATIVPLGGEAEIPVIVRFFKDLNVTVLAGKPTTLIPVLECLASSNSGYSIETILIAGENPSRRQIELLKAQTKNIYSPIFFSLETGIIGTQCPNNPVGTYHLSETVYIELIDSQNGKITNDAHGELVVTSLAERGSPCVRYRSGDRIRFLEKHCKCEKSTALFKLEPKSTMGHL
ncbi:MAG: hypothetical protein ACFFB3_18220 [Candidatus Hodarchaeota archaeon]